MLFSLLPSQWCLRAVRAFRASLSSSWLFDHIIQRCWRAEPQCLVYQHLLCPGSTTLSPSNTEIAILIPHQLFAVLLHELIAAPCYFSFSLCVSRLDLKKSLRSRR